MQFSAQEVISPAHTAVCGWLTLICVKSDFFCRVIHRKKLFQAVHMFVHLNLAISLLLGYLIFMFGIETATGSAVSIAATIKISISSYVGLDSNTNEGHIFADN